MLNTPPAEGVEAPQATSAAESSEPATPSTASAARPTARVTRHLSMRRGNATAPVTAASAPEPQVEVGSVLVFGPQTILEAWNAYRESVREPRFKAVIDPYVPQIEGEGAVCIAFRTAIEEEAFASILPQAESFLKAKFQLASFTIRTLVDPEAKCDIKLSSMPTEKYLEALGEENQCVAALLAHFNGKPVN